MMFCLFLYFQDVKDDISKLGSEGFGARASCKGTFSEMIFLIPGGLHAVMGYCGAPCITEPMKARFVRITNAGFQESHAHDVTITREAPNYIR